MAGCFLIIIEGTESGCRFSECNRMFGEWLAVFSILPKLNVMQVAGCFLNVTECTESRSLFYECY